MLEQTQLIGAEVGFEPDLPDAQAPSRHAAWPLRVGRSPRPGADGLQDARLFIVPGLPVQPSTCCLKGEGRWTLKRVEKEGSRGGLPSKQMRQKPEGGQGGRKAGGWAARLPGLLGRLVMTCHVTAKARPGASARSFPVRAGAWGAVPTLPAGTEAVAAIWGFHTLRPQQLCYPMFETVAQFPGGLPKRVLRSATPSVSGEVAWSWAEHRRCEESFSGPILCNPEQLCEVGPVRPHFAGEHSEAREGQVTFPGGGPGLDSGRFELGFTPDVTAQRLHPGSAGKRHGFGS